MSSSETQRRALEARIDELELLTVFEETHFEVIYIMTEALALDEKDYRMIVNRMVIGLVRVIGCLISTINDGLLEEDE